MTQIHALARHIAIARRRPRDLKFLKVPEGVFADSDMIPMEDENAQKSTKDEFISQLKEKYKILYNDVKPIPYIRDKLLRVDKVFVEGGIQYLAEKKKIAGHGTWEVLDSYHSILSDHRVQSSRYILEGDPGYGKTTLTLQLAYDWCKETRPSYMRDKDIFILLRLRQLGGVTSIYKAIKLFLLPKDSKLTEENVKDILRNSSSVLVVLDGYDEYPDQDVDTDCDIFSIILRNMFQKSIVILTTRTSCLPKQYSPLTKRLKLTGFDENARDQYIKWAVVGDDTTAAMELKQHLKKNPVLRDLLQIPLFFVMFAHISHESDLCLTFQTVTNLFRHLISCLHSHMKNKLNDDNIKMHDLFEKEHQKLDLLAFNMLKCKKKQVECRREVFCEELGKEFYDQYLKIGVLVEEEVLNISSKDIGYKSEVRFYHKLFCEWYAAHHLSEYASEIDGTFGHYLDPIDLQYLYLFACGLNAEAARNIIEYLENRNDADNFIIVCILEQDGINEHVLKGVKNLCVRQINVYKSHSLLLQRSTIQLLHIASINEICISSVRLIDSFSRVVQSDGICIQLKSTFSIPVLITLKKLTIEERCREITEEEMADILRYSSMCLELEELVYV
ncbi:NLR family CARD domain-containing protein 4 [Holothuria leucospilota]|uniref:NLR family CARD domain-containing protein 4 n=1 Tax=Holothuria leucospilota TaxID=206669 RepID=A0A9Q1HK62_HOLLE|nr:NLR family CARD domain-containing protein 4 [Holothuria leucospilota]